MLEIFDNLVSYLVIIVDGKLNKSNKRNDKTPNKDLNDTYKIQKKVPEEHHIYTTYENQRLSKGINGFEFKEPKLQGDRGVWTDASGTIDCPKNSFFLPSEEWRWLNDWHVAITPNFDSEGWEYSSEFFKTFHRSRGPLDFVRRRIWVREYIKIVSSRYF